MKTFRPIEDFWSDETESHYIAGLIYNGDVIDALLLERWLDAGLIALYDGGSGVVGHGEVT